MYLWCQESVKKKWFQELCSWKIPRTKLRKNKKKKRESQKFQENSNSEECQKFQENSNSEENQKFQEISNSEECQKFTENSCQFLRTEFE